MALFNFVYRDIIGGKEVLMPNLQTTVEQTWPEHQLFISGLLNSFGQHWKIVFSQPKPKRTKGMVFFLCGVTQLHIVYGKRKEMLITLYHELIHLLCPETCHISKRVNRRLWHRTEKRVERMAKRWYATGICPVRI